MGQLSNATIDVIEALNRAPSVLKVKEAFRRASARHGFDVFLCSAPPDGPHDRPQDLVLFEEWLCEWRHRYVERRHYLNDPMLGELHRTADPFLWSAAQTRRSRSEAEHRVMAEAAELGMREGYVVPLYGIGGRLHAVTMTGSSPRTDALAKAELHLISIYAYARAKQLQRRVGEPPISIGRREREALQWAAEGKSDWEIGEILSISESAAHKRIESAKRKLGVNTRMQAVVEAIRRGHIHL
jgi:LuxR family quorum sensing-dependent transcriptional regulator